jgi:hypothetical protein
VIDTLECALQYSGRGWAVFPRRADKHPITDHGIYDASTDPAVICAWWTRWPWASIGITTGDKIDVLDIDVRSTANGFDTMAAIGGQLPSTLIASTPSGGWHVYFQHIAGSRTRKLGRGLEWISIGLKGQPGNVVAPPAPGRAWINEDVIAEAPEWLRELVLAPRPNGATGLGRGAPVTLSTATRNISRRSRSILQVVEQAEVMNRTPALFWAACRFGEMGISDATGEAALMGSAALVGLVRDYGADKVRRQILNGLRLGRVTGARRGKEEN